MKYFKSILLLFLLIHGINSVEQIIGTNLVNNPSFEEYYSCPTNEAQLYKCKYWWGFSTDYLNVCANMFVSIPLNDFGFQYPHTDSAYAGLIIYTNEIINYDYREAIKTKLSDTLIANKRYCTNFYISLAKCSYSTSQPITNYILLDSIGMLFTKDSVQDTLTPLLNNGIRVQNDIFNIDTVNWFQMSNSFIANGGEQYLTISNFDIVINWPSWWPSNETSLTYVYVDDVSVCECSFKFSLGNDTTLCVGKSLTLSPNLSNATYTWQDSSHTSTYTVTHAGTYWVRAYFADYNITTTDTIIVNYYPSPVVNLGNDTTLCNGQVIILNDTIPNVIYQWQDSSIAKTDTVTQQGIYWLKVTDSNNCIVSDTIIITYINCDTVKPIIPGIYIPNSFTPNSDGLNDVFKIVSTYELINFKLTVYNRWGELIFDSDDINKGWDGTYKGKPVPLGVYVYQLTATIKDTGEQRKITGRVTVVR